MKNYFLILIFAFFSANEVCAQSACPLLFENLCASIQFLKGPFHYPSDMENTPDNPFTIRFWRKGDRNRNSVNPGIAPQASLFMHMKDKDGNDISHGGSPVDPPRWGRDRFLVTHVYFQMDGEWDIRVLWHGMERVKKIKVTEYVGD